MPKQLNDILNELNIEVDFIGFHGQTIFHDSKKKFQNKLVMENYYLK